MLLYVILPISLITPGYVIQNRFLHGFDSKIQQLVLSYTISMAVNFGILYIGSITFNFLAASLLILVISLGSVIYVMYSYLVSSPSSENLISNLLSKYSKSETIAILSIFCLVLVSALVLSLRPILDSDVAQFYLPIAREIVRSNGFTYSTGYDYNILLKPMGASVLYAWTYALGGSLTLESFRFLPIIPLLVMLGCIYSITDEVTQNKEIAMLSMLIFSVIPFQDRFLLYNAYYPDTFYYPLVFTSVLLILRYTKQQDWRYLALAGIALGVGGLLKAQTIYILIATLAIVFLIDSGWKRANIVVCVAVPFVIFLPNLLIETFRHGGLLLSLEGLSIETIPLFFFLSIFLVGIYIVVSRFGFNQIVHHPTGIKRVLIRSIILIVPVLLLSSLWYLTNLIRFGSIISTSTIDIPNYEWALDILEETNPIPPTVNLSKYLVFFGFMFLDPAVLGYIWSVVLLVGIFVLVKYNGKGSATLVMLTMLFASILFSQVIYTIPVVGVSTYNPRDIFLFAPMLCTAASVGISYLTRSDEEKISNRRVLGWTSIGLVAFYGFLGYIHSVVMWFANLFDETSLATTVFSFLTSLFGLTLRDTSFQIAAADRVPFPLENAPSIILLSLVGGFPIFLLIVNKLRPRFSIPKVTKQNLGLSFRARIESKGNLDTLLKSFLILSVILVPRGILFFQGGVLSVTSYSLDSTYVGLQNLHHYDVGGILTYRAPDGLPYYLPESKIIDFRWAANIAYLKDILTLENPREVAESLRDSGITHLLLNPILLEDLDIALNNTFSKLTSDITLTYVVTSFKGWILYRLGPFTIDRTSFSSLTWNISSRWTNSSYSFHTNETGVHLSLFPDNSSSRVTIFSEDLPTLSMNDYDLVQVNVIGTENARVFVRLFLNDSRGLDVAYWINLFQANSTLIPLGGFANVHLSGDIFIGLRSSDDSPAEMTFLEISFLKLTLP